MKTKINNKILALFLVLILINSPIVFGVGAGEGEGEDTVTETPTLRQVIYSTNPDEDLAEDPAEEPAEDPEPDPEPDPDPDPEPDPDPDSAADEPLEQPTSGDDFYTWGLDEYLIDDTNVLWRRTAGTEEWQKLDDEGETARFEFLRDDTGSTITSTPRADLLTPAFGETTGDVEGFTMPDSVKLTAGTEVTIPIGAADGNDELTLQELINYFYGVGDSPFDRVHDGDAAATNAATRGIDLNRIFRLRDGTVDDPGQGRNAQIGTATEPPITALSGPQERNVYITQLSGLGINLNPDHMNSKDVDNLRRVLNPTQLNELVRGGMSQENIVALVRLGVIENVDDVAAFRDLDASQIAQIQGLVDAGVNRDTLDRETAPILAQLIEDGITPDSPDFQTQVGVLRHTTERVITETAYASAGLPEEFNSDDHREDLSSAGIFPEDLERLLAADWTPVQILDRVELDIVNSESDLIALKNVDPHLAGQLGAQGFDAHQILTINTHEGTLADINDYGDSITNEEKVALVEANIDNDLFVSYQGDGSPAQALTAAEVITLKDANVAADEVARFREVVPDMSAQYMVGYQAEFDSLLIPTFGGQVDSIGDLRLIQQEVSLLGRLDVFIRVHGDASTFLSGKETAWRDNGPPRTGSNIEDVAIVDLDEVPSYSDAIITLADVGDGFNNRYSRRDPETGEPLAGGRIADDTAYNLLDVKEITGPDGQPMRLAQLRLDDDTTAWVNIGGTSGMESRVRWATPRNINFPADAPADATYYIPFDGNYYRVAHDGSGVMERWVNGEWVKSTVYRTESEFLEEINFDAITHRILSAEVAREAFRADTNLEDEFDNTEHIDLVLGALTSEEFNMLTQEEGISQQTVVDLIEAGVTGIDNFRRLKDLSGGQIDRIPGYLAAGVDISETDLLLDLGKANVPIDNIDQIQQYRRDHFRRVTNLEPRLTDHTSLVLNVMSAAEFNELTSARDVPQWKVVDLIEAGVTEIRDIRRLTGLSPDQLEQVPGYINNGVDPTDVALITALAEADIEGDDIDGIQEAIREDFQADTNLEDRFEDEGHTDLLLGALTSEEFNMLTQEEGIPQWVVVDLAEAGITGIRNIRALKDLSGEQIDQIPGYLANGIDPTDIALIEYLATKDIPGSTSDLGEQIQEFHRDTFIADTSLEGRFDDPGHVDLLLEAITAEEFNTLTGQGIDQWKIVDLVEAGVTGMRNIRRLVTLSDTQIEQVPGYIANGVDPSDIELITALAEAGIEGDDVDGIQEARREGFQADTNLEDRFEDEGHTDLILGALTSEEFNILTQEEGIPQWVVVDLIEAGITGIRNIRALKDLSGGQIDQLPGYFASTLVSPTDTELILHLAGQNIKGNDLTLAAKIAEFRAANPSPIGPYPLTDATPTPVVAGTHVAPNALPLAPAAGTTVPTGNELYQDGDTVYQVVPMGGGKYIIQTRSLTTPDSDWTNAGITLETLRSRVPDPLVEASVFFNGEGIALENPNVDDFGIYYDGELNGRRVRFYPNTGNLYEIGTTPATYLFEGTAGQEFTANADGTYQYTNDEGTYIYNPTTDKLELITPNGLKKQVNTDKIKKTEEKTEGVTGAPIAEGLSQFENQAQANAKKQKIRSEQSRREIALYAGAILNPSRGALEFEAQVEKIFGTDITLFGTDPENVKKLNDAFTFLDKGTSRILCDQVYGGDNLLLNEYPGAPSSGTNLPPLGSPIILSGLRTEYTAGTFTRPDCNFQEGKPLWFPLNTETEPDPLGFLYRFQWRVQNPYSEAQVKEMPEFRRERLGIDKENGSIYYRVIMKGKGCSDTDSEYTFPSDDSYFQIPAGAIDDQRLAYYDLAFIENICIEFKDWKYNNNDLTYPPNCRKQVKSKPMQAPADFTFLPEGTTAARSATVSGGFTPITGTGSAPTTGRSESGCPKALEGSALCG